MIIKRLFCLTAAAALFVCGTALADTKDKRVTLLNNYATSAWRQAMLKSWENVTKPAVEANVVASADWFTISENQVGEEAAQFQNMVLQGYNAIVVNAASPDGMNTVVKQACDAGVIVVSFDGIISEPCAWRISVDFKTLGSIQLDYLAQRLPKGGNVLEIRGLVGAVVDDAIHRGILQGVATHPQFKIVGSVHGNWDQDVAQKEVAGILPSLPEIAAVVTQGNDGYGVAQAFKAAGRPTPLIILGNHQEELAWWKEQQDASGYETMSVSIPPGASTLAFWVTKMVLDGKAVPKDLTIPLLQINQADLEKSLAAIGAGGVANQDYSEEDVARLVGAAK